MTNEDKCPKCSSENIYYDGSLWICPECGHEWMPGASKNEDFNEKPEELSVRDANGFILQKGDSVVLVKDLKVKGSSTSLKSGTKVKSIRITDEVDDHNISGKIDGYGSIFLKSDFVKKV